MIKAFIFDMDEVLFESSETHSSDSLSFIKKAKDNGVKIALFSQKDRKEMESELCSYDLSPSLFDLLLSSSDVVRFKPSPDIYSLCMIKLGLTGPEALVFERSEDGIKGAEKSGAFLCVLTSQVEERKRSSSTFVIDSFSSFPDFNSIERLDDEVKKLLHRNCKKYGANWIGPLYGGHKHSSIEEEAIERAREAMNKAYAPYSNFRVGAAVVSAATGKIYLGCNMENSSFGATICAERNAISTAVAEEGVIGIDMVVISSECIPPAKPCAICLQVMSEFIRPETPIILVSSDTVERYSYSDLLPYPFEFGD